MALSKSECESLTCVEGDGGSGQCDESVWYNRRWFHTDVCDSTVRRSYAT